MIKFKEFIGLKLEKRRKEMGFLTQQSLSDAIAKASKNSLDADRSRVSLWESGKHDISAKYIPYLCSLLKIDESFFEPMTYINKEYANNEINDLKKTKKTKEEVISEIIAKNLIKYLSDDMFLKCSSSNEKRLFEEIQKFIVEKKASVENALFLVKEDPDLYIGGMFPFAANLDAHQSDSLKLEKETLDSQIAPQKKKKVVR